MPTEIKDGWVIMTCEHCGEITRQTEANIGIFCLRGPPRCPECKQFYETFGVSTANERIFTEAHLALLRKAIRRHSPYTKWRGVLALEADDATNWEDTDAP